MILNENQQELFKSILIAFTGKANVLNKKEKQRRLKKAFPALTTSELNKCEDFFRTKALLTQKKRDIQIHYDRELKTLSMSARQRFLETVEEERINKEKEEEQRIMEERERGQEDFSIFKISILRIFPF